MHSQDKDIYIPFKTLISSEAIKYEKLDFSLC